MIRYYFFLFIFCVSEKEKKKNTQNFLFYDFRWIFKMKVFLLLFASFGYFSWTNASNYSRYLKINDDDMYTHYLNISVWPVCKKQVKRKSWQRKKNLSLEEWMKFLIFFLNLLVVNWRLSFFVWFWNGNSCFLLL